MNILEICGNICVNPFDGTLVMDKVFSLLQNNEPALLDFTGVKTVTASFLTPIFGPLCEHFASEQIDAIDIIGLDEIDSKLIHIVKEKAKRFHKLTKEDQIALIQAEEKNWKVL